MELERLIAVQQFLYREARLLDERRFDEWFELFTEDCLYWMPTRYNRLRDGTGEQWPVDAEVEDESGLAYFEDNHRMLRRRIDRLKTGMAWAEDPPSRTRHVISNVEAEDGEAPGEIVARSAFLAYRSRNEGVGEDEDFFSGMREDVLRGDGNGSFQIVRRKIVPDFVVINAQNLSIFF